MITERRSKPRVQGAYLALVRGRNPQGTKFEERAILDNVSAVGFYLRLTQPVEQGTRIFALLQFSNVPLETGKAPRIAAHGIVVRTDDNPDGTCGLGVRLEHYRFL